MWREGVRRGEKVDPLQDPVWSGPPKEAGLQLHVSEELRKQGWSYILAGGPCWGECEIPLMLTMGTHFPADAQGLGGLSERIHWTCLGQARAPLGGGLASG